MKKKPKRESPVYGYIDDSLKRRLHVVAQRPPLMSVSRIIEQCLERGLPEMEASRGVKLRARQEAV